jgi:hypothetical protein
VIPIPGNVGQNPVEIDSSSETGYFDTAFSTTEDEPGVFDGQLFTGFVEIWRFVKERGSKDNLHAVAVYFGRAVLILPGRVATIAANIA